MKHLPKRPVWLCQHCGEPWPCADARASLLWEYQGNRAALGVYLASLMTEAADQLAELDSGTPPADLTDRFLGWVRPRG
ncbi:flavin reductase [Micromonospora sp. U56]|uniref:flavin reductase n=1 Tax=Micromonospora sp. U56 TaxID=2824900 RepID=UPI001B3676A4|nr:flavin reductase [Micromonospora sp. U56]MBQ0893442.1 flavin reductase [Micromonospora sp. U56]